MSEAASLVPPLLLMILGVVAAGLSARAMVTLPASRLRAAVRRVAAGQMPAEHASFRQRVLVPAARSWAERIAAMTPGAVLEGLGRTLEQAGRPPAQAGFVLLERLVLSVLGLVAGLAVGLIAHAPPLAVVLAALFGLMVCALIPAMSLTQATERRRRDIGRALPDTLDLLVTTVEAGLGFEAALARVIEGHDDPLSQEVRLALTRMRYGQTRGEALREMGRRTGVEDVARFASAVAQADELGTAMGGVLRAQSTLLRRLRLLRSEEAAAKVPVKMLLPMVMFIMPGLFLLVLGPAVLRALSLGIFR
jgi:tight adherence protein C